ncbi:MULTISPECIES: AIPR family protein [unclassified Variovorax]|uniref:AIPR family protein n=1 Tax=unclassified Variovorax TaxID=663243 RepID=UPI002579116A|nr:MULTISPECIES: AIPR family protein [unclassified Variovorax]MDM0086892.1 AIPR family protein [Variovorax sp. J22G40]MDM0144852.1 AIPR family protein [Variovorax sp. J2P1-31]
MHLILKNHVHELARNFEHEGLKASKLFEYFCNYCVVSKHYLGRFDPAGVTTEEDDASLDGVAIVIDGDLITTTDDAKEAFKTHKTNLPVDIIFTQVKSGERFRKEEIANFHMGLLDYLSLDPKLPNGKLNEDSIAIFKIVLDNVRKVRNRRPSAHIYYCTGGVYSGEREIKAGFDIVEKGARETDMFHAVTVRPLGRGELLRFYADLTEKNEARLRLIEYFGMPAMPGIPQSYVAIVNALQLVEKLLVDADGNLRQTVFEENVRSYLGDRNDVNQAIQATLNDSSKKSLFSVLNNGITVVAPELTLTANTKEVHLTNYQIINGCQTSSTLYENLSLLSDDVNVVVKFIESPDNEGSSDIIAATNGQSNIPQEAFFGLRSKAKLVQKFFAAQNQSAQPENFIYFERRQAEFKHAEYQSTRIFDVREVARCYSAMFLDLPHNSARYVTKIFTVGRDHLFREEDNEYYYYAACLALYKYNALINGKKIGAPRYTKVRWHIIQMFKWVCHGKLEAPLPNSGKAEAYALKIIDFLTAEDKAYLKVFEDCQKIIDIVGFPTDDALKRGKFTQDLMTATGKFLARPVRRARARPA